MGCAYFSTSAGVHIGKNVSRKISWTTRSVGILRAYRIATSASPARRSTTSSVPMTLECNLRLYRTPLWQAEDQPSAGECIWARHTQGLLLGIFRYRSNRDDKSVEAVSKHRKQSFARARERKRTRAPSKQRMPANLFEQTDLVTDRRRSYAELRRSLP
jgi:hypothetical protein